MTTRSRLGLARMFAAVAFVAGVAGCAPQFRHLDESPFTPLGPAVDFEDGWLVVDSGNEGMHALVEMQVAAPPPGAEPRGLGQVALRLGPGDRWTSGRSRVEGPWCGLNGPGARGSESPMPNERANRMPVLRCFYVVRAEFDLGRLPVAGDSLTVAAAGRTVRLTWSGVRGIAAR